MSALGFNVWARSVSSGEPDLQSPAAAWGRAAWAAARAQMASEVKAEVTLLLAGIDRTEIERADGWWETSTGAEFGAERLAALCRAIDALGPEVQS